MKFLISTCFLTGMVFASQQQNIPHKNDLGMVIPSDGTFQGYNIDLQIKNIKLSGKPRGLIIGRGNNQGMAPLLSPFNNNIQYHWAYLDPYAIAHNPQNADPYLIIDFAARSPIALRILHELESCFDLIVIDRKTVQFFPDMIEIIYQCLGLLSQNGQLIIPIEDNLSIELLNTSELDGIINIRKVHNDWPFKGQNAPSNYGLDMSRHSQLVHYVIVTFKDNKPSEMIWKKLDLTYKVNKGYIPKLLKLFFMVNNGILTIPNPPQYQEFFSSIAQIFSSNNLAELQDLLQKPLENQENYSDTELGFIHWIIGEKFRVFDETETAINYFKIAANKKQIWAIYRLQNNENVDSSLDKLFSILSSEKLSIIINGNLMDSDRSIKDILLTYALPQIAQLQKYIPALATMTISYLQEKLPEFKNQSIKTLQVARTHRNRLLEAASSTN